LASYRAAIDIGGTFTDIIVSGADGKQYRRKTSSTPADYAQGVLDALSSLLRAHAIRPQEIESILHGTTVATNAILQKKGARVGLLTTRGFRDVLEIGRLRRSSLYDLAWSPPRPLVRRAWRLEVAERMDAQGRSLLALDGDQVLRHVAWLRDQGIDSLAIAFINAHANATHELEAARLVRQAFPKLPVSVSTELSPVIREYERTSTAVVNAYLQPVVAGYLRSLESGLRSAGIGAGLWLMQSNGGLLGVAEACRVPVLLVESGPAAGVRGAEGWAAGSGNSNVIALDVGGTTAKATLLENARAVMVGTFEVGGDGMNAGNRLLRSVGYPINAASYDLAEVSAGGGSIAWIDNAGGLRIGPQSAGAEPGPACYGRGGTEPTLTDAYLVMGWLNPAGLGGRALDPRLAEAAIREKIAEPLKLTLLEAAFGICEMAKTRMISALKAVSTERGRDPADFTLLAFGGGGPVLAHALAETLGNPQTVIPAQSGLYSAAGMLLADARRDVAATLLRPLETLDAATLAGIFEMLEAKARRAMELDGLAAVDLRLHRTVELHYEGQDFELAVRVAAGTITPQTIERIAEDYAREHERAFAHSNRGERIILVNLRVQASSAFHAPSAGGTGKDAQSMPISHRRRAYFGAQHGTCDAAVVPGRMSLRAKLSGPVIIEEEDTTIVVPPGWHASLRPDLSVLLEADRHVGAEKALQLQAPAIMSKVIGLALTSITEEMALALMRAAYSVGIRDIMDFSTSLCDAEGQLIAQSQTLAIHMGAVPPALAAVRKRFADRLEPGDIVVLNDPYHGGMHLADIFMVQPIFVAGRLLAYAVVTAHQVDMGGSVPGGNAASSASTFEEGLRIPPMKLFEQGRENQTLMAMIRRNVRMPSQVAGDLRAMMAACGIGARALEPLTDRYGVTVLEHAMHDMLEHAERLARAELRRLPSGVFTFEDFMDDDGIYDVPVRIAVSCSAGDGKVRIDFAGSSAQVRGGCNATPSVAQSAAYFALRCAMSADVAANAGYHRLIEVMVPEGSVVNPRFPASCAAKGVTAFRICDAILGVLGRMLPDRIPAAGEGGATVVTIAGADVGKPFVLMDLVLGGMGGTPSADGAEGIANPSCNVRNTPVEIIEAGFPLRIESYGFVPDSGGPGRFRGALSLCREYRFLEPSGTLQVRSDRHRHLPYGAADGGAGTASRNILIRDGQEIELAPKFVMTLRAQDVFRHVQAGAGGYGPPMQRLHEHIHRDIADGKITPDYARRVYGWTS
jgi:5-oxoprolinase (ATP-hydrolysing)/N-methylhydantoinase A